ncbi:hypothetical protein ABZ749_22865, partial [Micromonospora sp. NPDC047753]
MDDDSRVTRRRVGDAEARRANRGWWDTDADDYQAEHGAFLGDVDFVWCPEGLREADARLLGDVSGRRVLEVASAVNARIEIASRSLRLPVVSLMREDSFVVV